MKHDRGDLKGRADTDASLATERAAVNDAIERAVSNAEKRLDGLIARDRVLADGGISRVRRRADKLLAGERARSSEPSSQVVDERVATDDRKQAERSATDALFERERDRVDEHIEADRESEASAKARQEAHRQGTDEHLSIERSEAESRRARGIPWCGRPPGISRGQRRAWAASWSICLILRVSMRKPSAWTGSRIP